MLKSSRGGRVLAGLVAVFGALLAPQAAQAAIPSALGVPCTVQGDGVRFCTEAPRSTVDSPVDGWSLARDIEILLGTLPAVLSGRGAY